MIKTRAKIKPYLYSSNVSATSLLLVLFCVAGLYLAVVSVLEILGLGQVGLFVMVLGLPIAIYLASTFLGNVSGSFGQEDLDQFTHADSRISPGINAMAASSEWISLVFILGFISSLASNGHQAITMISGAIGGLLFFAFFIVPRLKENEALTLGNICAGPFPEQGLTHKSIKILLSLFTIIIALAFLVSLTNSAAEILILYFPFGKQWAGFLLLTPVVIVLLSGGMKSLTLANLMLFWVICAALYAPLIWLSLDISANPIPQLSYGSNALQPIQQIEQQLIEANSDALGEDYSQGSFEQLSGLMSFCLALFCAIAASACLPQNYARISCVTGKGNKIRSISWMLIIGALILSLLPAMFLFSKFEIYRDLLGLQLDRLGNDVSWLLKWARTGGSELAQICGKAPVSIEQIILACGNNPEYLLNPSDIELSPLIPVLGLGEIAEMPLVYSALTLTGLLTSALTAAAILFVVIINSINELIFTQDHQQTDVISEVEEAVISAKSPVLPLALSKPVPVARFLFVSRLMILVILAALISIIGVPLITELNLTEAAFAILAAVIFPLIVLSIWWKEIRGSGVLLGSLIGMGCILAILALLVFGWDLNPESGDELNLLIPAINQTLTPSNAPIIVLPITVAAIILFSYLERLTGALIKARKARKTQTQKSSGD